jgi:uncharacterized protein
MDMLNRRLSRFCRFSLLVYLAYYSAGCATYNQHAASMRQNLEAGRPDLALSIEEQKDPEQKDVLACMEKGMLLQMVGDYDASNQIWEVGKQHIEDLYGVSVTESLGSVTINDATRSYEGERFEQVLLHAYMAMNYLMLDEIDAARVEVLQADVKMREWGEQPEEDAFVRYFSGLVYEALGENDDALIAYRKAREVYLATREEQSIDVPVTLKKDLLRLLAEERLWNEYRQMKDDLGMKNYKPLKLDGQFGELIVILSNGLAPLKSESAIMTFSPEVSDNIRVAFPVYKDPPQTLNTARLVVSDKTLNLETVENVDSLARHSLEDEMPMIMTRAIARAVIKYNTQKKAKSENALAGFLMTVANIATERADTRSWTTLPQQIQMVRTPVPVGTRPVRIEMVNSAGFVVDTINDEVTIRPGQRSFIIKHWVAPVQTPDQAQQQHQPQPQPYTRQKHEENAPILNTGF